MEIDTNVANRFATTVVRTTVRNVDNTAAQTTFSMILPKSAFISGFEMKIGNGIYRAQVEEKAKAKQIYNDVSLRKTKQTFRCQFLGSVSRAECRSSWKRYKKF